MKRGFFKVFSVFVALVISFGFLTFYSKPVSAINNFKMDVVPRKVGVTATYKFKFSIEKTVKVHEWIKLWWPKECTLPPLPEDEHKRKEELKRIIESMSIGLSPCSSCQGLPIIDYEENSLKFNSHIELDPSKEGYRDITVTVPDIVGIYNPPQPGKYQCKVATQPEPTAVKSEPFEIVISKIGVPEGTPTVTVLPSTYKSVANYKIGYNVGLGGFLKEVVGLLMIRFPEGTVMTKTDIPTNAIIVNGKPLVAKPSVSKREKAGYQLTFNTPLMIADSGRVDIEITDRAGVVNPAKPGAYMLEVATSADKEYVASNEYIIEKGGALLKVIPPKVNRKAEYSFAFILEENTTLNTGDRVFVKFPEGTTIPKTLDKANILINDTPVSNVSVKELEVSIYSPLSLKAGDTADVKFSVENGITNTAKAGDIKLGYKLQNANEYLYTTAVNLAESKLELKEVVINPKNANSIASYQLPLIIGDNGALKDNDFIAIQFPETTKIPTSIQTNSIKINNSIPSKVSSDDTILKIFTSQSLSAGQEVDVIIEKTAGIRNPSVSKIDYTLSVFTSQEADQVVSEPFEITPPLPETTVQITGGKQIRDDWYVEPPLVGFTCSNPEATVYVYWDNKVDQVIKYSGIPQPLDLGQFESKLYYWAEDSFGVEETKMVIVKLDTVGPEIVIENPTEPKILTTKNVFEIQGRTTQIKTVLFGEDVLQYDKIVFINGTKVNVNDADGTFSMNVDLKAGENTITIRAEDVAGNFVVKEYMIISDSVAPSIEITKPAVNSVVLDRNTKIEGKTDDPAASITVNGEIAYVESDGTFSFDLSLEKVGLQNITIEAVDPIGNITKKETTFWFGYTVILQIGNKTGKTNGVEKTMNVAPFIQNSKTLVPFRFIGEQLNAEIGFTSDPKTKLVKNVTYKLGMTNIQLTINSKIALVNGKQVTLDVPAQIVKGSTVVPLRFVTEALGCKVDWEGKAQIITITYPAID
ncbi:MAG: stalk domain-containing protein [Caldisericia bacterium]|nr:stalk domain-containing protein [Caldisericia bacterium]